MIRLKQNDLRLCSVPKCNRIVHSKNLCNAHYLRNRYFGGIHPEIPVGTAKTGPLNGRWKGGQFNTKDGRVMVMAKNHPYPNHPDGYVLRYRIVMEQHLGRILDPSEIVHHKNEVISDDRIENLEITTRADHINCHRKQIAKAKRVAFAKRRKAGLRCDGNREYWNNCNYCGHWIKNSDFETRKATRKMISPDLDFSCEEWENKCPKCIARDSTLK